MARCLGICVRPQLQILLESNQVQRLVGPMQTSQVQAIHVEIMGILKFGQSQNEKMEMG